MSEREQQMRDAEHAPASPKQQARDAPPSAVRRDPDSAEAGYVARPAAPSAPARESEIDTEASDERVATTKTRPMARLEAEKREPGESTAERTTSERDEGEQPDVLTQGDPWRDFANRWDAIQSGFVDDPRRTVEQADRLVAEVIAHLSQVFTEERARLEAQWSRGAHVETEDLRVAMRRYRAFFKTLVGR